MKTALTFLLFLAPFLPLAQSSKVTSGKISYEQQQYDEALEKLNEALENPGTLKDKTLGQAWLYKGKALIGQYRKAAQDRNREILQGDNLLDAYNSFMKVYEVTDDKSAVRGADEELQNLQYSLFSITTAKMQMREYDAAVKYIEACKAINKQFDGENTYSYYNVSGQCLLFAGDTVQAAKDFVVAKDAFASNPPENIDFGVGYVYYYLGFIYRYQENAIDKALNIIQDGIAALEKENERLESQAQKYDDDAIAQLGQSYEQTKSDLQRFELDIYNNYPAKFDEALEKFKKAVDEHPNDVTILLVYATLLEQQNANAAMEVYKKVLEMDPNNTTALFNAGANRVNRGVEFAQLANEETDYVKSMEWQEKVDEQFEMALPYLEKCAELDPNNLYVLDALLQVTIQLDMLDKYKLYKEKKATLQGL